MFRNLDEFYRSDEWTKFRLMVINDRTREDGFVYDEVTGKPIVRKYDVILHHKVELTEDKKRMLDEKLHLLLDSAEEPPTVRITYFVPDERKAGGAYEAITGRIKEVDAYSRRIIMTDKRSVPLDDLWNIEWGS